MKTIAFNAFILMVSSPSESAKFYSKVFNIQPTYASATFVQFNLPNGPEISLWDKNESQVLTAPGATEISLVCEEVDDLYRQWTELGINLLHEPIDQEFGRTFVALDPDDHRVRVSRLNEQ